MSLSLQQLFVPASSDQRLLVRKRKKNLADVYNHVEDREERLIASPESTELALSLEIELDEPDKYPHLAQYLEQTCYIIEKSREKLVAVCPLSMTYTDTSTPTATEYRMFSTVPIDDLPRLLTLLLALYFARGKEAVASVETHAVGYGIDLESTPLTTYPLYIEAKTPDVVSMSEMLKLLTNARERPSREIVDKLRIVASRIYQQVKEALENEHIRAVLAEEYKITERDYPTLDFLMSKAKSIEQYLSRRR